LAIATRTGASVALIRLGFLITALFGGLGILLYAAAWALLPGQGESATPAEMWLGNLTTPGKRTGAFLIGVAALVILAGAAPLTLLTAVILLAAAALLADGKISNGNPAEVAPAPSLEETE
jgi:hypothetical protein